MSVEGPPQAGRPLMTMPVIVGILLAGGSASRFGGGKLAAQLPDGTQVGVAALKQPRGCRGLGDRCRAPRR